MRLFIAIDPPESVKQSLWKQTKFLRDKHPAFRYMVPSQYHCTVSFLGNQFHEDEIVKRIEDILFQIKPFELYARRFSVFANHTLTVHLNFYREKKLEELVDYMQSVFPENIYKNTKFVSHITVARARRSSKQQYFSLQKDLEKIEVDLGFSVNSIILFQSIVVENERVFKRKKEFFFQENL